jgi:hypothetical protein
VVAPERRDVSAGIPEQSRRAATSRSGFPAALRTGGSAGELQLATVETASAVLDAQVIEPFPDTVGGLDRLHRLVDAYPPHSETETSAAHRSASTSPGCRMTRPDTPERLDGPMWSASLSCGRAWSTGVSTPS